MLRRTLVFRPAGRLFSSCTVSTTEPIAGRPGIWRAPWERRFNLHTQVTPTLALLDHGNLSYNKIQNTQQRFFFFGSGDDNNGNDDTKGKGNKDTKEEDKNGEEKEEKNNAEDGKIEKEDDNKDDEGTSSIDPDPSPSLNNSSKYKRSTRSKISLGNSTPSNVLLPAHRLGFGDQAPRYPHLLALPVVRGPVFPGVLVRQ